MKRDRSVWAVVAARMTSSRLPGKVLMPAVGKPMLELLLERLRRATTLDGIVVATTTNAADDPVVAASDRLGVPSFRGSEADVLSRVIGAADAHGAAVVLRVTGDCPLIDPGIVDRTVRAFHATGVDYASTTLQRTFPRGIDAEVVRTSALRDSFRRSSAAPDREHVTLFIVRHPELYSHRNVAAAVEETDPDLRLTVDTREDYALISAVFEGLYRANPDFALADILSFVRANPGLRNLNRHVQQVIPS